MQLGQLSFFYAAVVGSVIQMGCGTSGGGTTYNYSDNESRQQFVPGQMQPWQVAQPRVSQPTQVYNQVTVWGDPNYGRQVPNTTNPEAPQNYNGETVDEAPTSYNSVPPLIVY